MFSIKLSLLNSMHVTRATATVCSTILLCYSKKHKLLLTKGPQRTEEDKSHKKSAFHLVFFTSTQPTKQQYFPRQSPLLRAARSSTDENAVLHDGKQGEWGREIPDTSKVSHAFKIILSNNFLN